MKKLSTGFATDELSMKPLPRGQSISLIDRYLRRITCGDRVGDVVCKMALVKGPSTATGSSGFVGHWSGVVQRGGRGIDGDAGGARSRLHALVAVVFTSLAFRVLHRDHSQGAQRIDDALFRLHDDDVAGGVSARLLSWRRMARGSRALLR